LDPIFINWNKLTFSSLNKQFINAEDSVEKFMWQNRLSSFKSYLGIESEANLNDKSIRYKFLQTILLNPNVTEQEFYVIEANESGSKILLRIFVLYKKTKHKLELIRYNFESQKWRRKKVFTIENQNFQLPLISHRIKFGNGFNYDDIVFTKFKKSRVVESEYFLYATLPKVSGINSIINYTK
jgi:hypothetical protein